MMRVLSAGLLLALAREATGAGCPVVVPTGAWPQGAAYQAVSAGKPNAMVPPKQQGFNRTVSIEGICVDSFSISSSYVCASSAGEFKAGLNLTKTPAAQSPVALKFGGATCPLTAISVYKTTKASGSSFKAEMRFQFEPCIGGPVTSAAVVVGIRKDAAIDFNLPAWTKQVCPQQTTTAAPVAVVKHETDAVIKLVGQGMCDGTVRRKISGIATVMDCKLQCVSSATKANILNTTGCTGFSFKATAADENCITFSGNITKVVANAGWECYNMDYKTSLDSKATPAPTVVVTDAPEVLAIKEVLGVSASAYFQQITPPLGEPTCFASMWWLRLEDRSGQPLSVPIKAADYDAFLADIPEPIEPSSGEVSAPQIIDRVLVDTCTESGGWGAQACFVPVVEADWHCRKEELTGAVISGVITAILTWIMVAIWFGVYMKFGSKNGYDAAAGDESGQVAGGSRVCTHSMFQVGMILVAIGGACLSCWLSLQFLNAVMRSAECFDVAEFMVVIISVVLSVALAIIFFSLYLAFRHPAHPHPFLHETPKQERTNTKLMLVEVQDGTDTGHSLDSMVGTKQGALWTGFQSQNSGSAFGTVRPGDSIR